MSMSVHNLMAFNHQFFRPQAVAEPRQQKVEEKTQSFQEILNEKLRASSELKR